MRLVVVLLLGGSAAAQTNCATYGIVGEDTCAEVCPI
jgi:hypothetical protein